MLKIELQTSLTFFAYKSFTVYEQFYKNISL